jgi:hypothetical protein
VRAAWQAWLTCARSVPPPFGPRKQRQRLGMSGKLCIAPPDHRSVGQSPLPGEQHQSAPRRILRPRRHNAGIAAAVGFQARTLRNAGATCRFNDPQRHNLIGFSLSLPRCGDALDLGNKDASGRAPQVMFSLALCGLPLDPLCLCIALRLRFDARVVILVAFTGKCGRTNIGWRRTRGDRCRKQGQPSPCNQPEPRAPHGPRSSQTRLRRAPSRPAPQPRPMPPAPRGRAPAAPRGRRARW